MNITNSTLSGNMALGGNATSSAGHAGGNAEGGGPFVSGNGLSPTLSGLTLDNNSAQGGAGGGADGTGAGGNAYGGAAYLAGSTSAFNLVYASLSGNTAQGGTGGNGGDNSKASTATVVVAPVASVLVSCRLAWS